MRNVHFRSQSAVQKRRVLKLPYIIVSYYRNLRGLFSRMERLFFLLFLVLTGAPIRAHKGECVAGLHGLVAFGECYKRFTVAFTTNGKR